MTQGSYANLNGLEMYYEVHGSGKPLVLLHGGFGVVGMFGQVLPALAKNRQVIAVELEGHGHTALLDRPTLFRADGRQTSPPSTHTSSSRRPTL